VGRPERRLGSDELDRGTHRVTATRRAPGTRGFEPRGPGRRRDRDDLLGLLSASGSPSLPARRPNWSSSDAGSGTPGLTARHA
jgi:hypothetical protein